MKRSVLLVCIFSLLLAACSTAPQATDTPQATAVGTSAAPTSLDGTRWVLESLGANGEDSPVIPGSILTLQFQPNGQVSGNSGCNSFGGSYEVRDSRITFLNLVSTLMACADNAVNQQESQYLQALNSAVAYELAADRLTITYGTGSGRLNFVPAD